MQHPDVAGRPWKEAEQLLQRESISYETKLTRPTRDFFETDERKLYVIRAKSRADGIWEIVLAARMLSRCDPC